MSKKICILNGSPRPNGNTKALITSFTKGAEDAGNEVVYFDLQKMNIHGCLGCCRGGKDPASPCVQKDDMEKIYPAYRAADVVVLPYRTATQSGISSISYHFDVPMIVTDTGGLKAAIGDTGTGLVADSISPEAVRKEIVRYFSDPEIRENCIRNIEKEKKRLSWTAFCDALTKFSNEL